MHHSTFPARSVQICTVTGVRALGSCWRRCQEGLATGLRAVRAAVALFNLTRVQTALNSPLGQGNWQLSPATAFSLFNNRGARRTVSNPDRWLQGSQRATNIPDENIARCELETGNLSRRSRAGQPPSCAFPACPVCRSGPSWSAIGRIQRRWLALRPDRKWPSATVCESSGRHPPLDLERGGGPER